MTFQFLCVYVCVSEGIWQYGLNVRHCRESVKKLGLVNNNNNKMKSPSIALVPVLQCWFQILVALRQIAEPMGSGALAKTFRVSTPALDLDLDLEGVSRWRMAKSTILLRLQRNVRESVEFQPYLLFLKTNLGPAGPKSSHQWERTCGNRTFYSPIPMNIINFSIC